MRENQILWTAISSEATSSDETGHFTPPVRSTVNFHTWELHFPCVFDQKREHRLPHEGMGHAGRRSDIPSALHTAIDMVFSD